MSSKQDIVKNLFVGIGVVATVKTIYDAAKRFQTSKQNKNDDRKNSVKNCCNAYDNPKQHLYSRKELRKPIFEYNNI